MLLDLYKLHRDMDEMSVQTWRRVLVGDAAGLKFREDSITDQNLFELMERHPQLSVKRFTQNKEKEVGADWEWWIGSNNLGWFRLRIQAKRVHRASYAELDHLGFEDGEYQYETLIRESSNCDATYPFHVFYNGWRDGRFKVSFDSDHADRCGKLDQSLWGCSVMSSHAVKKLHLGTSGSDQWRKRSSVPRYIPELLPWSRLFTGACTNYLKKYVGPGLSGFDPAEMFRSMHRIALIADRKARGEMISQGILSGPRHRDYINDMDQIPIISHLLPYAESARSARRTFMNNFVNYNDNYQYADDSDFLFYEGRPNVVAVLEVESDLID
ncbi:DUF6615 family protein [Rhodococcus sp. 1.20]